MSKQTRRSSSGFDAGNRLTPGRLAELACLLEVNASKPGNVHRFADLPGLRYTDFHLERRRDRRPNRPRGVAGCGCDGPSPPSWPPGASSRPTPTSAWSYYWPLWLLFPRESTLPRASEAVLAGRPSPTRAGLSGDPARTAGRDGRSADQDLGSEPTMTLRAVMSLAAERRSDCTPVRRTAFIKCSMKACQRCVESLRDGQALETAIVAAYLHLLAQHPDSLIARKHGSCVSATRSRAGPAPCLAAGWPMREEGQASLR